MTAPTWLLPFDDPRRLASNDHQRRLIAALEALAIAAGRQIRSRRTDEKA